MCVSKIDKSPLFYAEAAVETMMKKYRGQDLPPRGHFLYHQGVFLSGVYQTYLLCGKRQYFDYIKDWVDSCVDEDGRIHGCDPGRLDDIQPGILLFPLLEKTGDGKYKKALDSLAESIKNFPRNEEDGFWHMKDCPDQMWLDGLYMGGPIAAEYGSRFHRPEFLDLVVQQALMMRKKTRDPETGLWYHAWDGTKRQDWADPQTGLSPEFWGRSIGWVPVAVLDELDFIPKEHPGYEKLCFLVKDLLEAVCRYQSEDGRWYQVVDKGGMEGNWLENSCSCLFTAALCKAVAKGILPEAYLKNARRGYEGVIHSLEWDQGEVLIGNVCVGTCVGDYRHYCERPTAVNDLHGVGAFLLMCAQVERCAQAERCARAEQQTRIRPTGQDQTGG